MNKFKENWQLYKKDCMAAFGSALAGVILAFIVAGILIQTFSR